MCEQPTVAVEPLKPAQTVATWSSRLGANVAAAPVVAHQRPQQPAVAISSNTIDVKPVSFVSEPDNSGVTQSPEPEKETPTSSEQPVVEEAASSKVDQTALPSVSSETTETVSGDVDEDGFQEVKKRKPKPQTYSGSLTSSSSQRSFPRSASFHQTSNHGALSSVPFTAEAHAQPGAARISSFENSEAGRGTSTSAFGAVPRRGFGRGATRFPRGGAPWSFRSQRPMTTNDSVGKAADDTDIVIMKSLQYESPTLTATETDAKTTSESSWADQVEVSNQMQSAPSASSWSQIVRTRTSHSASSVKKPAVSTLLQSSASTVADKPVAEDCRPSWARVDTSSAILLTNEKIDEMQKETEVVRSRRNSSSRDSNRDRDRSVSPPIRGRNSFRESLSSNNEDAPAPTRRTESSTVYVPPPARQYSPKRRNFSPPRFSALIAHSDKRVLPSMRGVNLESDRSPLRSESSRTESGISGNIIEGTNSTSSSSSSSTAVNISQTTTSNSISSVFGSDKNNAARPRQMAVVKPYNDGN